MFGASFSVGLLILVQLWCVDCAFFDLTDIDDPLALLWNTKDSIIPAKNKECTVQTPDNSFLSGVCKPKAHCHLSGGQVHKHGTCGILSTCCTYQRSCGRKTNSKVSYFSSGEKPQDQCEFVVEKENSNICQVRLDFEVFKLSPATRQAGVDSYHCQTDVLTVTPNTYNVPPFCGFNEGQHVYVHLNHEKEVRINVILQQDRLGANVITKPTWKIKITQLECPGPKDLFAKYDDKNVASDFKLLAPVGAIQYFTERNGRIRSLGFDGRDGNYTNGLSYGIAFKRTPSVNCVKFTANYLFLRQAQAAANAMITDESCKDRDYLFVPELNFTSTLPTTNQLKFVSKICVATQQTNRLEFISRAPGPFYIHFVSAPVVPEKTLSASAVGFDLEYELHHFC